MPRSFVQAQRPGGHFHPFRFGEDLPEQRLLPGLWLDVFLQGAHIQGQVSRADADRTDRIAGQAVEAGVHLLDQVGAEFQFAFQPFARQRHPAARRGDLAQVFPVSWADRQAQPAADAIQILFFGWLGRQMVRDVARYGHF